MNRSSIRAEIVCLHTDLVHPYQVRYLADGEPMCSERCDSLAAAYHAARSAGVLERDILHDRPFGGRPGIRTEVL